MPEIIVWNGKDIIGFIFLILMVIFFSCVYMYAKICDYLQKRKKRKEKT